MPDALVAGLIVWNTRCQFVQHKLKKQAKQWAWILALETKISTCVFVMGLNTHFLHYLRWTNALESSAPLWFN